MGGRNHSVIFTLSSLTLAFKRDTEIITLAGASYFYGQMGAGKTSIARLIDYCLGGDIALSPALQSEFEIPNVMQVPGLVKIVVNMGVGEAARDSKLIEGAIKDLTAITGQKPSVTKARKSIAQFKLREGMPIGAHVTLRGDRMWEFLDRLLSLALPRIRDFRGLSPKQFDGRGNYTFGLTEQVMFHEINQDRVDRQRGMDITVVTTATTDDHGRALLKQLGFPFKEN